MPLSTLQRSSSHPNLSVTGEYPCLLWRLDGWHFHLHLSRLVKSQKLQGFLNLAAGAWLVFSLHERPSLLGPQPTNQGSRLAGSTCPKHWPALPGDCRTRNPGPTLHT